MEYRLQVASMYEAVFIAYLNKPAELAAGATGPGLDRLESLLDAGELGKGGLLLDRHLQAPPERLARLLASARFLGEIRRGGAGQTLWDEVRWEGEPGGQSIWVVRPAERRPQELARVAVRAAGPLRHHEPVAATGGGERAVAVRLPLATLLAEEDRRTLWTHLLGPAMDLRGGLAAVVGVNEDRTHPDLVYLVVSHDPVPTTYKAVLVWRGIAETGADRPPPKRMRGR
jgi:hypothetical protein